MRTSIGALFRQFGELLGLCPCCGEVFRVIDARPYFKEKPPHSIIDDMEAAERRLDRAIERLDELEKALRAKAREQGAKQAKKRMRQMDRTFSGAGLDPQDVKVIFDPVEYVIFDGLNSDRFRRVLLLAHPPEDRYNEQLLRSIEETVKAGNFAFKTLRVMPDGKLALK